MTSRGPIDSGVNASGKQATDEISPLSSELQLVRILDRTLRSRYPDGVSLLQTLEGGQILELHRLIRQPFNPNSCSKAEDLTTYLWLLGRVPSLEPGGGLTIRDSSSTEKYVIGRAFFREAEEEYRLIHGMIAEALGR